MDIGRGGFRGGRSRCSFGSHACIQASMEPKSFLSYLIKTNVLKLEVQWLLLRAKMIVATTDPHDILTLPFPWPSTRFYSFPGYAKRYSLRETEGVFESWGG